MRWLIYLFLMGIIISPYTNASPKQMIVIGIDGFQYEHYKYMLESGYLTNFTRLILNEGWNGTHKITGHDLTETKPGNAELHTGLNSTYNLVSNNSDPDSVPDGKTTFERLKEYNSSIKTGLIYGKTKDYLPRGVINNSFSEIDWWNDKDTYPSEPWIFQDGTACDNSINVSIKATEFISDYQNDSYYLFIYFGVPDCTGHKYGENSLEYNLALENVDSGLGIILNYLENLNLENKTQIIITADHGWEEGTTGHSLSSTDPNYEDTSIIPLITNNKNLTYEKTRDNTLEQCEITPTILDYFEIPKSNFQDIFNNGCDSMMRDLKEPLSEELTPKSLSSSTLITLKTNEATNYTLFYWLTPESISSKNSSGLEFLHNISLTNLTSSTVYYYNLTFCDFSGNCNDSLNKEFTTTEETKKSSPNKNKREISNDNSNQTTNPFQPSIEELKEGYSQTLKESSQIKFGVLNTLHTLTINSIEETISLTIQSDPITLILKVNEIKKINLTNQYFYDLEITINEIKKETTNISLKIINESIILSEIQTMEEETQDNQKIEIPLRVYQITLFILGTLLIIGGIFLYIHRSHKKKKDKIEKLKKAWTEYEKEKIKI